jgi:hypothetical protein
MKPGMALSVIKTIRKLPANEQKKLLTLRDELGIDSVLNGLFRPV